jgi:hypothetical protein
MLISPPTKKMSKNKFSRALGVGRGRDTNPLAHGTVIKGGKIFAPENSARLPN